MNTCNKSKSINEKNLSFAQIPALLMCLNQQHIGMLGRKSNKKQIWACQIDIMIGLRVSRGGYEYIFNIIAKKVYANIQCVYGI